MVKPSIARTNKYYCFNPETNKIIEDHSVRDVELTPIVFCDLDFHEGFVIHKRYMNITRQFDSTPWYQCNHNDPVIPNEFKTQLILLGINYE